MVYRATASWTGGLREIDWVLRDFRTGEARPIDGRLLDLLWRLRSALDTTEPYEVISGYRSPATNAMLRREGRAWPAGASTPGPWPSTCGSRASPSGRCATPRSRSDSAAWATIQAPASSTSTSDASASGAIDRGVYVPKPFDAPDVAWCHELIRREPFAILVGVDPGGAPFATHLPVLLDERRPRSARSSAHVARPNPQWQLFAPDRPVLVVFPGRTPTSRLPGTGSTRACPRGTTSPSTPTVSRG